MYIGSQNCKHWLKQFLISTNWKIHLINYKVLVKIVLLNFTVRDVIKYATSQHCSHLNASTPWVNLSMKFRFFKDKFNGN